MLCFLKIEGIFKLYKNVYASVLKNYNSHPTLPLCHRPPPQSLSGHNHTPPLTIPPDSDKPHTRRSPDLNIWYYSAPIRFTRKNT